MKLIQSNVQQASSLSSEQTGRGPVLDSACSKSFGFTLIELLVVIAVAGILAALAIPAIKEFGRSNAQVVATRQLLNDVGRARQLAIANRTTVYMVFLPPDYLVNPSQPGYAALTPAEQKKALRLAGGQGRSYALISLRTIGDQPGQNRPQYLTEWKTLPPGWIIDPNKFNGPLTSLSYTNFDGSIMRDVSGFEWSSTGAATNALPFPAATAPLGLFTLPYIAFHHGGGLQTTRNDGGEVLTLARGTVDAPIDGGKNFIIAAATLEEFPVDNGRDVPNLIFIEGLTGRAKLEQRQIE